MGKRVLWIVLGTALPHPTRLRREDAGRPDAQDPIDYRAGLRSTLQTLVDQSGDPLLPTSLQLHPAGHRGRRPPLERGRPGPQSPVGGLHERLDAPQSPPSRELSRSQPSPHRVLGLSDRRPGLLRLAHPARPLGSSARVPAVHPAARAVGRGAGPHPLPRLSLLESRNELAFEDGYLISPWGRGNLWYRGIAETDIWEGMATVKALVRVDESRQYLCGHSMGGYGAWHIAHRSADVWAALGVHAGALRYDVGELDASVAAALRDLPTYFVVGTSDGLLNVNQIAYVLLQNAGNLNLAFVTFPGGHDYRQSRRRGDVPVDAAVHAPPCKLGQAGFARRRRRGRTPRSRPGGGAGRIRTARPGRSRSSRTPLARRPRREWRSAGRRWPSARRGRNPAPTAPLSRARGELRRRTDVAVEQERGVDQLDVRQAAARQRLERGVQPGEPARADGGAEYRRPRAAKAEPGAASGWHGPSARPRARQSRRPGAGGGPGPRPPSGRRAPPCPARSDRGPSSSRSAGPRRAPSSGPEDPPRRRPRGRRGRSRPR